jgi:serine O-acetyltransferase
MLDELRADFAVATEEPSFDLRQAARALFNRPGLQAMVVYRVGRWLRTSWKRPASWPLAAVAAPVYVLLDGFVRATLDIHIAPCADLGPGLTLYHFGGVRLRNCRVGANCVLHHQVRLEPDAQGRGPELADRVWVGPHARIVGPIRVGEGATIGAGAVVKQDVAARAVVVGDPARVVRYGYDNSELLARE